MSASDPALPVRAIRRLLLDWYQKNQRALPWRRTRDPYRIWVSEIMLQQTRVAAAIGYYQRFLERFPGIPELAAAPEQDLLTAWAGLGYYARVRNLQKAAKKILELGAFPRDYDSLRALAGVGDYTAAAIASIAFDLPHAALDGNAIRVLTRLTAERGNVASTAVRKRLRAVADRLVDPNHPGEFNQAWMELGAVVCLPKEPQCSICPLQSHCAACRLGCEHELPLKAARPSPVEIQKQLLVIRKAAGILVWQRETESRRLAGFWELPEPTQIPRVKIGARIGVFRHTIVNTNYSFQVHQASARNVPKGFRWLPTHRLDEFPLSTAAKKALACLTRREQD
ncbi:MAG TPA: A/G-specific adenine glycosylase [Bryobacteraceae bacterium]|nr:A/G-specific adenine glycosylase [Bryobacteraceae bacterium]